MSDESIRKGAETRAAVLGEAHVARTSGKTTDFDGPFYDMIVEGAWGNVWSSDAITKRERSMITLALLAGLGNWEEFKLHLRATINTGATKEDVREVLHHVSVYAGVPRGVSGFRIAREIYAEMEG